MTSSILSLPISLCSKHTHLLKKRTPSIMSSGALSPQEAAEKTLETGHHHLTEALQLTFLKNIYGGMLLGAAGILSLTLTTGSPGLTDANPGLHRVLQACTFPIGLVLVYFIGAELFTGYPMW
jgi:formate/nitrite transporter FocA (FNT family)